MGFLQILSHIVHMMCTSIETRWVTLHGHILSGPDPLYRISMFNADLITCEMNLDMKVY